jgi:hypothetical protein
VATLKELNDLLEDSCFAELERRIAGRDETVGEAFKVEQRSLRELPFEDFDASEQASPRVDTKALVTIRQNHYSVPVGLVGLRVAARIGAREIVISHGGRRVARHPRLHGRFQTSARLDHYLELLQRKPGALKGSLPLRQERERGRWPACFDQLWQQIEHRYGASEAARQMVDVLLLVREQGVDRVELAVRGALAAGAHDGRAVAVLARRNERPAPLPLFEVAEHLKASQRPQPTLGEYDTLLQRGGAR